jgi:hypothetical protein
MNPRFPRPTFILLCLLLSARTETLAETPSAPKPAAVETTTENKLGLHPAATAVAPAKEKWAWLSNLLPKSFQSNPNLEMTVITELTPEGRQLPPASPDHPVYYQGQSNGNHPMGDRVGGQHPVQPAEMERLVTHALAVNGYLPAKPPAQPPSLLVVLTWGTHNRITVPGEDDANTTSTDELRRNILERAALVGGRAFAEELAKVIQESQQAAAATAGASRLGGFTPMTETDFNNPVNLFELKNPKNQFLLEQALDDCYYVVASAYDYPAATQGIRKLLWRTRMTVNAQGVSVQQALPTVVASASQYFGRELKEPEIVIRRVVPDGKVELGTPTVVNSAAPKEPEENKK